jgi:nucleotide-binding universal stress UspA family protein
MLPDDSVWLTETERGVHEIPLAAIVGSVGRYSDFTRTFLPRQDSDQDRSIEVYKVGEVYFVLDGNHRVSIARQMGLTHLEAHVIEVKSRVPLTPNIQLDDLIVKAEYADFLDQTGLGSFLDVFDLGLTAPGQYEKLKELIECYRETVSAQQSGNITYTQAAETWYNSDYLPTVLAIRERGLLRWFPGRTEADLYLWVLEHWRSLETELGWAIRPEAVVTDLAVRASAPAKSETADTGSWRRVKLADRYADHLFKDVLVPLAGTPESWQALDQAIPIAQREDAQLFGLHVIASEQLRKNKITEQIQEQFLERCQANHVTGQMVVEVGEIANKICERALLADLVVMSASHPPTIGLTSGWRTILWKCARPILTVPNDRVSQLDRALLIYDGSSKAKEALFVATYLAERHNTNLMVLAGVDGSKVTPAVLDYPRQYLEWHELQAEYLITTGTVEVFLKTAAERNANLILMGGYSVSQLEEFLGGSAVSYMMRETPCPLLICR